jgi:putative MFS transporter
MPTLLSETSNAGMIETYGIIAMQQACGLPGILLASWLINTALGRKWTTAIPFFISGLLSLVFFFFQSIYAVTICTMIYSFFAYMGWGAIYTIVPESYDTSIRSFGVGWTILMAKIGGILAPTITGYMLEVSFTLTIFFLAVCGMLAGIISAFMRETRGKVMN